MSNSLAVFADGLDKYGAEPLRSIETWRQPAVEHKIVFVLVFHGAQGTSPFALPIWRLVFLEFRLAVYEYNSRNNSSDKNSNKNRENSSNNSSNKNSARLEVRLKM